jgi:hypothetical protein
MWHAHLARVFTDGMPGPLFELHHFQVETKNRFALENISR